MMMKTPLFVLCAWRIRKESYCIPASIFACAKTVVRASPTSVQFAELRLTGETRYLYRGEKLLLDFWCSVAVQL